MLKACRAAMDPRPRKSQPTVLARRAAIRAPTVAKPGTRKTWGAKKPPPRLWLPSHSQMAVTSRAMVRPHNDQASHPLRRDLTGNSFGSFRPSTRLRDDRLGIVTADRQKQAVGGEQAANPLQPADSSRHATTLDAKVSGTTAASPLVAGRPYLLFTQQKSQVRTHFFGRPGAGQPPVGSRTGLVAAAMVATERRCPCPAEEDQCWSSTRDG